MSIKLKEKWYTDRSIMKAHEFLQFETRGTFVGLVKTIGYYEQKIEEIEEKYRHLQDSVADFLMMTEFNNVEIPICMYEDYNELEKLANTKI